MGIMAMQAKAKMHIAGGLGLQAMATAMQASGCTGWLHAHYTAPEQPHCSSAQTADLAAFNILLPQDSFMKKPIGKKAQPPPEQPPTQQAGGGGGFGFGGFGGGGGGGAGGGGGSGFEPPG